MNSLVTGSYVNLPISEYHADSAVGSSTLKTVHSKSPLHAKTGSSISSKAADYGTAFHVAILEPERFEKDVVCGPEDRRGNRWKDLLAENVGKTVLVQSEYEDCCAARDALWKSATIQGLLGKKKYAERSIFWRDEETGLMLKARPDFETTDCTIVDLKTTVSARCRSFENDAFKYCYHIQEAHYLEGMNNVEFDTYNFVFLAVEKSNPFAWTIFEYDDASRVEAKRQWRNALNLWAICKEHNDYLSYTERDTISIPKWAMPSMFDEE